MIILVDVSQENSGLLRELLFDNNRNIFLRNVIVRRYCNIITLQFGISIIVNLSQQAEMMPLGSIIFWRQPVRHGPGNTYDSTFSCLYGLDMCRIHTSPCYLLVYIVLLPSPSLRGQTSRGKSPIHVKVFSSVVILFPSIINPHVNKCIGVIY